MRRLYRRKGFSAGRLAQLLDRAAGELNPLLLALAVGLLVLNLTCFITLRFLPSPQIANPARPAEVSLRDPAG